MQKTEPGGALSGLSWSSDAEWALLTHKTCVYMKVPSIGL